MQKHIIRETRWEIRLSVPMISGMLHRVPATHTASTQGVSMAVRKTSRLVKKSGPGTNGSQSARGAQPAGTAGHVKDMNLARASRRSGRSRVFASAPACT